MKTGYQRPGSPASLVTTLLAGRGWMESTAIAKAVGIRPADVNAHLASAVRAKRLWKEVREYVGGKRQVFYKLRTSEETITEIVDAPAAIGETTPAIAETTPAASGLDTLIEQIEIAELSLPKSDAPMPSSHPTHAPARMLLDDTGELLIASEDGAIHLRRDDVHRLFGFLAASAQVFAVRRS